MANKMIADKITSIDKAENIENIIIKGYREILKRDPDPGGLEYYSQKMKKGLNIERFYRTLKTSDEYIKLNSQNIQSQNIQSQNIQSQNIQTDNIQSQNIQSQNIQTENILQPKIDKTPLNVTHITTSNIIPNMSSIFDDFIKIYKKGTPPKDIEEWIYKHKNYDQNSNRLEVLEVRDTAKLYFEILYPNKKKEKLKTITK